MGDTIKDPVFGPLIWDGGWGGSFEDAEYITWGAAVSAAFPDDDEEEDEPSGPKTEMQDFIGALLSTAGGKLDLEADESTKLFVKTMTDMAKQSDAYDASKDPLDADRLRRSKRLKVVVRNERDKRPTKAQRAAWKAFRDGGTKLAERIAAELLKTYRQQRPERVRWWKLVYGDSPNGTLPDIKTSRQMRTLVRPSEFRVYGDFPGHDVTVTVVLESFWAERDLEIGVRNGEIVGIQELESDRGISTKPPTSDEIDSAVFGKLRWNGSDDEWIGVYRSDALRGYDEASEQRHKFKKRSSSYETPYRPGPSWKTITGDFPLAVAVGRDGRQRPPLADQEAAYHAFNADPTATAKDVLTAILKWYRKVRPHWIKHMNGSAQEKAAILPNLRSSNGLLEIIELQSVMVLAAPDPKETIGPRTFKLPFGPGTGKKITVPARKGGVAIVLWFHWHDEHGLAARWRDGKIEKVGTWDDMDD